jgi:hypothetical protein
MPPRKRLTLTMSFSIAKNSPPHSRRILDASSETTIFLDLPKVRAMTHKAVANSTVSITMD